MFIKRFLAICFLMLFCEVYAAQIGSVEFTDSVDINNKLLFLDKLYDCEPHKYHASPTGIYEVRGRVESKVENVNGYCKIKWTIVNCNFPDGVYQKFSDIQRKRTLERYERNQKNIWYEIKDKDYRYLLDIGNLYCTNSYADIR